MLSILIIGGHLEARVEEARKLQGKPSHLDLDGSTGNILLDQIRSLQHGLSLVGPQPHTCLILEAHNLTIPAQNALLKTIEEPPSHVQIILTAEKDQLLLPTVVSRCQIVKLKTSRDFAPDDKVSSSNLLKEIVTTSHGGVINLAEKLARQTDLDQTIKNLLILTKNSLKTIPSLTRSQALKAIGECYDQLQTNANKQLILEHLFFTLKTLVKS